MTEQKMSLIEQLQNPPYLEGGALDTGKTVDLMREGAHALSTMIGVASKLGGQLQEERAQRGPKGYSMSDAQAVAEPTEEDRQYASELLADLANGGTPRLEIAARWFRKARLENRLSENLPDRQPRAD